MPAKPISTRRSSTIKNKMPTNFCVPREFPKMFRPCLVIIKSCYFDYRINKTLTCSCCLLCVFVTVSKKCRLDIKCRLSIKLYAYQKNNLNLKALFPLSMLADINKCAPRHCWSVRVGGSSCCASRFRERTATSVMHHLKIPEKTTT